MMSEQSMDRLVRTMMELCVQSAMAGARPSSSVLPDGTPSPATGVPQPNVRPRSRPVARLDSPHPSPPRSSPL